MASQNSYPYATGLPYDVRRSQSQSAQSAQFASMQNNNYPPQFPDDVSHSWTYSQSPTSPLSPVSPASIGASKTYTLAGALNPRPKSRQHPASASHSLSAVPASNSSSTAVSGQHQSAIQHASAVSTTYGSPGINTGNMRSSFKQPAVPILSQPQPPSRVSMNAMRSPVDFMDDDDLEGDYVVEVFDQPNQYDEPGATSNAHHFHSAQGNNGQFNAYQPVSSPSPELQYPLGVSGTPEDFRLGLRATHQAAFGFYPENLQMQMQAQQLPSSNPFAANHLPAHMQQQQFRYMAQAAGDHTSRTADAGAHYAGSGTGAREAGAFKEHDFLTSPAASSLASSNALSGRSAAAQNIVSGLQKGKDKEREHAAMPALPGVPADHGHGGSKPAKSQNPLSSSSSSIARSRPSVQGTKEAKPNSSAANTKEPHYKTVKVDHPSSAPGEPPKKVKMHQCPVCDKLFPRPSGLDTHMNSHSGARPFKCPLELCNKTFAVRSNARRHLKTHGITLPGDGDGKDDSGKDEYQVGFEDPVVINVHEFEADAMGGDSAGGSQRGRPRQRRVELRWVPPSLAGRTNVGRLRSLSPASDMADVDAPDGDDGEGEGSHDDDEEPSSSGKSSSTRARTPRHPSAVDLTFSQRRRPGLHVASTPLHPVKSTDAATCGDLSVKYEERNSYAESGVYPYHPQQWRCLPGPALVYALHELKI
ncbi:hypothetical protein SCHPADRAFT_898956 [Schizopora paradoxa]|uniref:C2H2-type domain-containing protein n=1 Tax=Schizopora paradoxa TaxID=27342 RepID=A0A0H2S566_9AGAM|nr:hypothetical protein SCHPADRAFT_898956 [Schizopora paradoxa]